MAGENRSMPPKIIFHIYFLKLVTYLEKKNVLPYFIIRIYPIMEKSNMKKLQQSRMLQKLQLKNNFFIKNATRNTSKVSTVRRKKVNGQHLQLIENF